MSNSNVTPISTGVQARTPQAVESRRKRRQIEPQVPSIRKAIFGQWLNGALESTLADRYGCAVCFVNAVLRSETRQLREQLRESRIGRAA